MTEVPERKYTPEGKARDAFDGGLATGRYQGLIEQTAFQRDKALKREKFYWGIIFALVVAMVYVSLSANYRVYPVRIDNATGRIEAGSELKAMAYSPREAEIKYFLSEFIRNIRTVGKDPVVFRQNWEKAQHFVTPEAGTKLSELVRREEFFDRVGKVTCQPEIKFVEAQPGMKNTYQVRWTELSFFEAGQMDRSTINYIGLFTIDVKPQSKEEELRINPLGIMIVDLTYSKESVE